MKIYLEKDVFPLGTKIKSKMDSCATSIRMYEISEIYRTYNTNRKMVMLRYDLSCNIENYKIYGIEHDKFKSHYLDENKKSNK